MIRLIERLINFIKQLLSDTGLISSMRYMAIMTVTTFVMTYAYLCIHNNYMMDLPWGAYAMFATAFLGKLVQFKYEQSKSNDDAPATDSKSE